MPEPIDFQILQNLQTALRTINAESGFHYTVAATAVKLDPNQANDTLVATDGPRPFVLIEVLPETWEYSFGRQVVIVQPFRLHWVHESDPADDASRLKVFFRGCADVEEALAADLTRGGLAKDTQIVGRQEDDSIDGATVWAQIEVKVLLERKFGEPNA